MAQVFDGLIQHEDKEQEEHDVRHAADHGGVEFTHPAERQDRRTRGGGGHEAEGKRGGGRDRQKREDHEEGLVEQEMRAVGQVAAEPAERVERIGVGAELEHLVPWPAARYAYFRKDEGAGALCGAPAL